MTTTETNTAQHKIASRDEWLKARTALLAKEKEFTRQRDELSRQRRELPWVKVDTEYVFDAPEGKVTLGDLFADRSQLIVYHFMFDPEWSQGCKSCSLVADHYEPAIIHLEHRDVSLVTVSRAPLEKLLAFRERMGWKFHWVSSFGNSFNHDFHVSFTKDEVHSGNGVYNYVVQPFLLTELPGFSVFYKNEQEEIFHTYSTFARGIDMFLNVYHLLDVVPKGRDEENCPNMSWVRHHDRYDQVTFIDPWMEKPGS